jgi:hypothetical protein
MKSDQPKLAIWLAISQGGAKVHFNSDKKVAGRGARHMIRASNKKLPKMNAFSSIWRNVGSFDR